MLDHINKGTTMRRLFTAALLLLPALLLTACATNPHCESCSAMNQSAGVYRHVVVFKFKDTTTDEQVQEIVQAFGQLENQIDSIIAYEHGINVSPEGHDQGFTHCFTVTFADASGLETYLPHPAHTAFVEKLLPLLEEVFVVDYVAQ